MTSDNLILEHLRFIRGELSSVKDDTREIRIRLSNVESSVAGLASTMAAQQARFDRLHDRMGRIETRQELRD